MNDTMATCNGLLLSDLSSASHQLKQSLQQTMTAAGSVARRLKQTAYPSGYPDFKPLSLAAGISEVKAVLGE